MTEVLNAALEYAGQAIPVFPADPKSKKPLSSHGFKDATTDARAIERMWKLFPDAMIGMPTGAASRLWALDIDYDIQKNIDGYASMRRLTDAYGALPATLTSVTPRGGRHLLFSWDDNRPVRNQANQLGPGLDVRGAGGYVVLPPSVRHDGAVYAWDPESAPTAAASPEWLLDQIGAVTGGGSKRKSAKRDRAWAQKALDEECAKVASAKPGTRNATLNEAAFNLFQIVHGGLLDANEVRDRLFAAATACGLVADDGANAV